MGLDMYLTARKFVSGYEFHGEDAMEKFAGIVAASGFEPGDLDTDSPTATVSFTAVYWRKANALHQWFVQNVQEGVDNCGDYYVSKDDLQKLQRDLTTAITDKAKAPSVLPTASGFFFGGTDYDEYYWGELRRTLNAVNHILTNDRFKDVDFYYQSSW